MPTQPQAATTTTPAEVTNPNAACDRQSDLPLGDDLYFRDVGSTGRQYQLYIPASYRVARPVPLILDFHAYRSDPLMEGSFNGFETVAEKAGFVLARPQAESGSWSLYDGNEVEYVEAVLGDARSVVCVDPDRIYATGMSQGGQFATELTCRLPATFAAVASVAVFDHPVGCSPEPTPVIAFTGRNDAIYDLADGLSAGIFESANPEWPPDARPGPLKAEAEAWAVTNGCKSRAIVTDAGQGLERWTYGCPKHFEVVVFVHDGGHVWPAPGLILQLQSNSDSDRPPNESTPRGRSGGSFSSRESSSRERLNPYGWATICASVTAAHGITPTLGISIRPQ